MVWEGLLRWVKRKRETLGRRKHSSVGWNSWNHFHCNINEKLIRQTADAIVATGLAAAGYQYSLFIHLSLYSIIT